MSQANGPDRVSFPSKLFFGSGSIIALDLIAFPRGVTDATSIPPEKIFLLGAAVGPGMLVLYICTLYVLSRYRITRERHREIMAELEARKATPLAGLGG